MSVEVIEGLPRDAGEARKPAPGRPVVGAGNNSGPLVMGPRPERVYSHALLLELKEHPLARQWPPYLDPAFKNARGVWDPDRWHLDRKRGETPVGQEANGPDAPKERKESRKEKTGGGLTAGDGDDLQQLVLSPQRKSFLSGCNSGAGGGGGGEPEVSLRPEQPGAGNKRVGSGRLLSRPGHDRGDEERGGFRRGEEFKRFPGDNRRDDKFGSGFRRGDDDGGWGGERRDGGFFQHDDRRGDGRRMMDDRRPQRRRNEPEWMSETISHNDIIELRGFDDKPSKKQAAGPLPLNVALGIKNGPGKAPPGMPTSGINVEDLEAGKPQRPRRKPSGPNDQNQNLIDSMKENVDSLNNIDILNDLGLVTKSEDDHINFDKIMESMLGGTSPGPQELDQPKSAPKSRFSQFFNKGAAGNGNDAGLGPGKQDSRRSSIQDELLGANILKEINGEAPLVKIPSPNEEERYFAPISPAAQTRNNPILDMIQKGGAGQMPPQPPSDGPHRVQDLEENLRRQLGLGPGVPLPPLPPNPPQHILELLKQGHPQNGQHHPHHRQGAHQQQPPQQAQSDMSAFKKLVAMVGQNPEGNTQGIPFGPGVVRPSPLPAPGALPSNAPTEQEILDQMMSGRQPRSKVTPPPQPPIPPFPGAHLPPPIASFLAAHPLNLELVARPEGKQLLVGLETGNITIDHLVAQVSNPALQQRQRDVLLSVLKLVTMQRPMGPPLMPGPPPGHDMLLPGQTQASRVSPLMFPPGTGAGATPGHLSISPAPQQARVPSPQEMTVLTQQIMQQALIKRKLEEQKENYRKKHGDQPMPLSASPLPLAFTPTSVMRKNAAERKDSDPAIKPVPELKITSQKEAGREVSPPMPTSPGRAITKGKDDRPASLDLAAGAAGQQRRMSPQQMFPPQLPPPHANPLMYLQNNPMGPVSQTMLSQANAMAQQQLAARMMAQGIDPMQFINRLPGQPPVPAPPLSPSRLPPASGPGMIPGMLPSQPGQPPVSPGGQGPLARFFSPEVLAAAQSGAVPAMPPMPGSGQTAKQDLPMMPGLPGIHSQHQKVLTLEEIERQAAAVRM